MSITPESVVPRFLAVLEGDYKVDEIVSFFAEDAVYIDGPRGTHHGVDAIRSELQAQSQIGFGPVAVELKSLVADSGTVMLERIDRFSIGGNPVSMEIMEAFEIDGEGRIKRWRQSYDLKSILDQFEAAGIKIPE